MLEEYSEHDSVAGREFKRLRNEIQIKNKMINNQITNGSVQAIIDYIEEGEPDINVVKAELGELILRSTREYASNSI